MMEREESREAEREDIEKKKNTCDAFFDNGAAEDIFLLFFSSYSRSICKCNNIFKAKKKRKPYFCSMPAMLTLQTLSISAIPCFAMQFSTVVADFLIFCCF
jgi:hypothetical protein